jgi:hypothetical protein
MISKGKTINKAISKYKEISPIRGKQLNDCFFYVHGEILFVFRTSKDKKIRTMKAIKIQPVFQPCANQSIMMIIYQTLTKPISFSSLIGKLKEQVALCLQ